MHQAMAEVLAIWMQNLGLMLIISGGPMEIV